MANNGDYFSNDNGILLPVHFTIEEIECRCGCGMRVETDLITSLEMLRLLTGEPLHITSGARCPTYNKKIGGASKSRHLIGIAADMRTNSHSHEHAILRHAPALGFNGIGVAEGWLHLDRRQKTARWTY